VVGYAGRMKSLLMILPALAWLGWTPARAELPALLKPAVEAFDQAMRAHDEAVAARIGTERSAYLAALAAARRIEAGAGRQAGTAAIDREIAAVQGGSLPEQVPAGLPAQLQPHRQRFAGAPARAAAAQAGPRRHSIASHLKWLEQLAGRASAAKDETLAAAIASERRRVLSLHETAPAPP
jgi:hypothetical protein